MGLNIIQKHLIIRIGTKCLTKTNVLQTKLQTKSPFP